ncbi:unnamed protein product, partial [Amoebophrya sp. A25]
SSITTWRINGKLTDNIVARVLDQRQERFLRAVRETGVDLISNAKTKAARKFGCREGSEIEVGHLAALWCIRARFILDRLGKYFKDQSYRCSDKERLQTEFEAYTADIILRGEKCWPRLQGENKKAFAKVRQLCDVALDLCQAGYKDETYDDMPDYDEFFEEYDY